MPTYEYACTTCGEHLEVVQSFRDDPLTECPACGGPLRKVFGSIGVVFKGSGFYKTDSRPAAKSSGSASSDSASAGSADKTGSGEKTGSGTASDGGSKDTKTAGKDSKAGSSSTPKSAKSPKSAAVS